MLESTHIAMSKAVLDAVEWPGDRNYAARNAAFPDEVRSIEVEKYGAHVIGKNLSSLVHFCRPTAGGHFAGYCWSSDKSVPKIDLSKVQAISKPDEWGFPVQPQVDIVAVEPFALLLESLRKSHSSLQADEVTYTTSAVMAGWTRQSFGKIAQRLIGQEKDRALGALAGWTFHLGAQDPVMPHHANGTLLDGHSAFEGDVDELYKLMEGSGEIAALLKTLVPANNVTPDMLGEDGIRLLAECCAKKAYVAPWRLCVYMTLYRHGWKKLVRRSVLSGLTATVQIAKVLKQIGWH